MWTVMSSEVKPIETNDLGVIYKPSIFQKPRVGLESLNLSVEQGEIFGYLGGNGAGKTTTLKVLVGLLFPTSGSAKVYGKDISDPECRRQIGFLPENPYFYEYLSAAESLLFYGRLAGISAGEVQKRIDPLLERVGLSGVGDTRVKGFSKGMRQRLGLAVAILAEPDLVPLADRLSNKLSKGMTQKLGLASCLLSGKSLLILDEPMSGLDPRGRRDVRELIVMLRDEGKTILFSSHILPDVESVADRIGMLKGGRLVASGPIHDIVQRSVTFVELVCEDVQPSIAEDAGITPRTSRARSEGGVIFELASQADGDTLVAKVIEAGGRVLSLTPHAETLEDVFRVGEEDSGSDSGAAPVEKAS